MGDSPVAGMKASAAKAASDRTRRRWKYAVRMMAAVTGPSR
jgi:ribosomal protein L28